VPKGQTIESADAGAVARVVATLAGARVSGVTLGPSRELMIELPLGQCLVYVPDPDGHHEWTLFLPHASWVAVQEAELILGAE